MKVTIQQNLVGEDEVLLKYRCINPEVKWILKFLNNESAKLTGWKGKNLAVLQTESVLYLESVVGKTFAYTE